MKRNVDLEGHDEILLKSGMEKSSGEKPPGVYVRANEHQPGHELDMLWSGNRGLHLREDRSPVIFFITGLIIGALVTAAVCFFFFIKPNAKMGENELTAPVIEQERLDTKQGAASSVVTPQESSDASASAPATTEPVSQTPSTAAQPASVAGVPMQHYAVKSGDTLEKIAHKFYGSGTPDMVEKITRANNMKNPNALKLDQDLVIPPKAY
jgi:LysM repeat protein